MGKDKYENEELIKFAWHDVDVWFHVEDLSSAHVYLRLPAPVESLSEISDDVVQECAQLTKANSIEGCKKHSVGINYTWAKNLKKTIGMQVGAVSYHSTKEVQRISIDKDKEIVKKVMKTKTESFPNLELEYRDHLEALKVAKSAALREEIKEKKEAEKAKKIEQEEKKQEMREFTQAQEGLETSN